MPCFSVVFPPAQASFSLPSLGFAVGIPPGAGEVQRLPLLRTVGGTNAERGGALQTRVGSQDRFCRGWVVSVHAEMARQSEEKKKSAWTSRGSGKLVSLFKIVVS